MARLLQALLLLALLVPATALADRAHDEALARLSSELNGLDADPSLGPLARFERLQARQALALMEEARWKADRESSRLVAERRVEAARVAAEAELLERQAEQLDRERDQLLIEASQREAERARRETERLRLQALAREEEAERRLAEAEAARIAEVEAAAAEAEQARKLAAARAREAELARREAELAAALAAEDGGEMPPVRQVGGNAVYTLSGNAFASGRARLTAPARASLVTLARTLSGGQGRILIVGHTDSQGDAAANQALSRQRAEAVREALVQAGLPASRLVAEGRGEAEPIADNASADGRARNRRVELTVEGQ